MKGRNGRAVTARERSKVEYSYSAMEPVEAVQRNHSNSTRPTDSGAVGIRPDGCVTKQSELVEKKWKEIVFRRKENRSETELITSNWTGRKDPRCTGKTAHNSNKMAGNVDYRLNIRIGQLDGDLVDNAIDRDISARIGDGNMETSNFHITPTVKVTNINNMENKAQLNLPLEMQSGRLSPMGRIGGESGSSTPRLRISTPKSSSPPAGIQTTMRSGSNGPAPNGKAQETEKKIDNVVRSTPSSRRTVVIIAGLFVVGLILILSGIIVLSVEEHLEFRITGGVFLGCGIIFFIICLILQKKNVKKLVNELEKDLYFLNVTDNKIWNFIFHFDEQVAWTR